jgi:SAM-dependent methyltransferase
MDQSVWSHDENADHRGWLDLIGPSGDELDKLSLDEIVKRRRLGSPVTALEIDCGEGEHTLRMAKAGASVVATHPDEVCPSLKARANAAGVIDRLQCQQLNPWRAGALSSLPLAPFDVVVSHRTLPFMRYDDAQVFVRALSAATRIGGRLFLSAFGLHSELGDDYPDANRPVRERFSPLAPETAQRYDLTEPVCLYSERDLFMLLFSSGVSVIKTFSTTHGNVKAVGVRV